MKKAQQENNIEDMKTKRDDLNKIVQDLTVKLYEQAQKEQQAKGAAQGSAASGSTGAADKGDDGKTFDGEYKDVNDDKK